MSMSIEDILSASTFKTETRQKFDKVAFFRALGIADNGISYVSMFGWNEKDIEGRLMILKNNHARYNGMFKAWISKEPVPGVDSRKVDFNQLIKWGWDSQYHFKDDAKMQLTAQYLNGGKSVIGDDVSSPGFVGTIGERIKVTLKISGMSIVPSKSDFGDFTVIYFKDDEGRQYSWFQRVYSEETIRSFMKKMRVKQLDVVGTVKRHITRLGVHTTDLTRCEVSARGNLLNDFAAANRVSNKDNIKEVA